MELTATDIKMVEKVICKMPDTIEEINEKLTELRGADTGTMTLKEAVAIMGCDIGIFWGEVKGGRILGAKKVGGRWDIPIASMVGYTCPDRIAAVKTTLAINTKQLDRAKEILAAAGLTDELAELDRIAEEALAAELASEDENPHAGGEPGSEDEMEFDEPIAEGEVEEE